MRTGGPRELVECVQQAGLCIGCGACVDICPYFKHYRGKTVQVFSCDLEEGRCFAHCPKIEVDQEGISRRLRGKPYEALDLGDLRSVRAARAGRACSRGGFQGGGTVSALAAFALRTGRIDAAVLTDRQGPWPLPRVVTREDQVFECASSKFTAAATLSALNGAARDGYERIGLVGTPCQITAAAQMKGNPLNREDFADPVALSIGLFCNWALDPRGFNHFLSQRLDISRVTGMDIPPPPADVLVVWLGDDTVDIPLDEIRPFIPETCSLCPDLTSEWADLSVGMLEGRPGWNTLVIRSESGESLVEAAEKGGFLESTPMPRENLEHLEWAGRAKKRRAFQKALQEGRINSESGSSILRAPPDVIERFVRGH